MSPELKQFYIVMQNWINAGFPSNTRFHPRRGLCGNLRSWANPARYKELRLELTMQFTDQGLFPSTPFDANLSAYEHNLAVLYKNPKRLAWIEQHAVIEETSQYD